MGDEEQVTPAVQLLDECLVEVAVQCPVAKGWHAYACREVFYPTDGLMHRGRGEQPQHHTDSRHGGFRLAVGLVSIKFRTRSAASLRDYHANATLVRTGHVRRHALHGRHFRSIQHRKRRVLFIQCIGHALNGRHIIAGKFLVAAPDGQLPDATAGEVLYRLDFCELVTFRFRKYANVQRDTRIDAENLRKLVVQHPHTPALGIVLDAQRLGSVDGGNGLHMLGLEAVGNIGLGQIGDETRHMVFARHALGHVAVLSFDF